MQEQLALLNELAYMFLKQTGRVQLRTFDNCHLSWEILELDRGKTAKFFNTQKGYWKTYRRIVKTARCDHKKSLTCFLPGLIHVIDSSILRSFVVEFFTKTGLVLTTVHDSFATTPSKIPALRLVIREVFQRLLNMLWLKVLLVDPMLERFPDNSFILPIIARLLKKSEIPIGSFKLDFKKMYKYEK